MLTLHFSECYSDVSGNTMINNLDSYHHPHQHHLDYSNSSSSLAAISPHSAAATTPSPLTDSSMDTAAVAGAASGVGSSSTSSVQNASPQSDGPNSTQYYFDYSTAVVGEFETSQGSLLCPPNLGNNKTAVTTDETGSMLEHNAVIAPGTVQQRVYPIVYGDTSMIDKSKFADYESKATRGN